jgi:large subunit ribosomal protein L13
MSSQARTYMAKTAEIEKRWFVVDAEDVVLGRLAVVIATRLRGKHKAIYTPHIDCGDNIIVVNAEKVKLTGRKKADKKFFWHTGFPGGVKERTIGQILASKYPERVIEKAVERMVPRGPLGRQQMRNLRVYAGATHPHEAQAPAFLNVASMNPKNTQQTTTRLPAHALGKMGQVVPFSSLSANRDETLKPVSPFSKNDAVRSSGLEELEHLMGRLNEVDERRRAETLRELGKLLARVTGAEAAAASVALRRKLRGAPDQLLSALLDDAESELAGPAAAFALVQCLYPEKYRNQELTRQNEATVLEDLSYALKAKGVDAYAKWSFVPKDGEARVEAVICDALKFRLGGMRIELGRASIVDRAAGLNLVTNGAKIVMAGEIEPRPEAGEVAGCWAKLQPVESLRKNVSVYLRSGEAVIDKYVLATEDLFRGSVL